MKNKSVGEEMENRVKERYELLKPQVNPFIFLLGLFTFVFYFLAILNLVDGWLLPQWFNLIGFILGCFIIWEALFLGGLFK